MGYKLLIKAFILSIITVKTVYASRDFELIDKLVREIKKERTGLNEKELKNIKNPFVCYIKNSSKKEKKSFLVKSSQIKNRDFRLNAIINNKAKINNKWYKIGSNIDNYKIVLLNNQCIKLKNGNDIIKICIKNRKKILFSTHKER